MQFRHVYMNFRQNFSQKKKILSPFQKKTLAETVNCIPKGLRKGNPFHGPFAQLSYHILYNWRRLSALTFMVCNATRGYVNFNTKCGNPPTPNKLPLHPWCLKNNHFRFWTFLGHYFQGQFPSVPRHSKLTIRDAVVLPIPWVFGSIWDNGPGTI